MKTKVLFICSHNTTRSQIAQALLSKYGGENFEVLSAGIKAGELNPMAVEVILEDENIDISSYTTNSILDYFKQVFHFHYVITGCNEAKNETWPIFPGLDGILHWNISSPASEGSFEEKKAKVIQSKNELKVNILEFIKLVKEQHIKSGFPESWHLNQ